MIAHCENHVWLLLPNNQYYRLGAGMTELKESAKTTLLETPRIDSPVCGREILSHTAQLEFRGYRVSGDPANDFLAARYLKRGNDAKVTMIVLNTQDALTNNSYLARRVTGFVCVTNPGSGITAGGSRLEGTVVYAAAPEEGAFNETLKRFLT